MSTLRIQDTTQTGEFDYKLFGTAHFGIAQQRNCELASEMNNPLGDN